MTASIDDREKENAMMSIRATHIHESRLTRALRAAPLVLLFLVVGYVAVTRGVSELDGAQAQVAAAQSAQAAAAPAAYRTAQYVSQASLDK